MSISYPVRFPWESFIFMGGQSPLTAMTIVLWADAPEARQIQKRTGTSTRAIHHADTFMSPPSTTVNGQHDT
jgi:hypothetical protein